MTDRAAAAADSSFSLLDDPLMRSLRALHLAPRHGFRAPQDILAGNVGEDLAGFITFLLLGPLLGALLGLLGAAAGAARRKAVPAME